MVSNCLDPDQDRRSVGSDLGPNCLQRLSADNKNHWLQGKRKSSITFIVFIIYQMLKFRKLNQRIIRP